MPSLEGLQGKVLELASTWADKHKCIEAVYIFGSFVRGDANPKDIDIGVWYTKSTLGIFEAGVVDFTAAQASSVELEECIAALGLPKIGWTGIQPFREAYDFQAW